MKAGNGWTALAAAIIKLAVEDRDTAIGKLKENPGDVSAAYTIDECNRFFSGKWCMTLLDICGIGDGLEDLIGEDA